MMGFECLKEFVFSWIVCSKKNKYWKWNGVLIDVKFRILMIICIHSANTSKSEIGLVPFHFFNDLLLILFQSFCLICI